MPGITYDNFLFCNIYVLAPGFNLGPRLFRSQAWYVLGKIGSSDSLS